MAELLDGMQETAVGGVIADHLGVILWRNFWFFDK